MTKNISFIIHSLIGNTSDKPNWYIFEKQYFAETPIAEIINNNLRTTETNSKSILCYLKEFLQMNVCFKTDGQYEVSFQFKIILLRYLNPIDN